MSETANLKLFLPMLLAGVLVMSGVSVKNSGVKLWGQEMMLPGMLMFVGGWFLAGISFGFQFPQTKNAFFIFLPIIGIVATAMLMNKFMKEKKEVPMGLPIIFVISWLIFVGMIALESNFSPFIATGLVFYSMMYLLPMARKSCAADNLGMVYFFMAWVILSMAKSPPLRLQSF